MSSPTYGEEVPQKLFVYGIFLGEYMRERYGMKNPHYATVKDFLTVGEHIVEAVHVPDYGLALTGLLVDPDNTQWDKLDALEAGYDRVVVRTTSDELAWMYARKGTKSLWD